MPNRLIATALLLSLTLTTGCSMSHGDPKNPKKNPHPVKRYEVIATADAPGPWDAVKGYVSFMVSNVECVHQDSFTGARNVPNINFDFEMMQVDEKTWRGYFYRDLLQDEDYFGLGVCHWDATSALPDFTVHGEAFTPGPMLEEALHTGPQKRYFKKSQYWDHLLTNVGALEFLATDPEVIQHPDAFFPVSVTVREVTP